jgi:N,N'-diacetyllegionaminate synthase
MVYVLAEVGVNHNGSIDLAFELIDIAVKSGADGVKFQTFISGDLAAPIAKKADYQVTNTKNNDTQLSMLQKLELSYDEFRKIRDRCIEKKIEFISTPFDLESADFLHSLDVHTFKIGSGDLTNFPLLKRVASFGKRVILSTGMGSMEEVENSVNYLKNNGCADVVLLHCVSCYPTQNEDLNLKSIRTMREKCKVDVGFSDHTVDYKASLYAVCLGATYIEKHFTIDKNMDGPDHKASLDPNELTEFVSLIRECETILGDGDKKCRDAELNTKSVARRSLYFNRDMNQGEIITENDLIALRPNSGICASKFEEFIGKTLRCDVSNRSELSLDFL